MKNKAYTYGKYTIEVINNTANKDNWIVSLQKEDKLCGIYYHKDENYFIPFGKYKGFQFSTFDVTLAFIRMKISYKVIAKFFDTIIKYSNE